MHLTIEENKKEKDKIEEEDEGNTEIEEIKKNKKDSIMKIKLFDGGNDEYFLFF